MDGEHLRILIVEDHADTADVLAAFLHRLGYRVTTAMCHAEATRLCEAERFDLLIADVVLPDGDGLHLLQVLRDVRPGARGIVLSAHHRPETIARAERIGFDDYLIKPAGIERIVEAIKHSANRISLPCDDDGSSAGLHA